MVKPKSSKYRGAQLPNPVVDEHAEAINACWLKHRDIDNEVAIACHRANIALDVPAKQLLMKRLLFSEPKFSKYASIGGDARLLDPKRAHKIPQSPSIKYELSQLEDGEFDEFEAEGRLTPTLRRAEVTEWRRKKRGQPPPPATPIALPGRFYAALEPKRQLADSEQEKINTALFDIATQYEMEVVHSEGKLRLDADEKARRQMRREAKKIVTKELKRLRTAKPKLGKYGGYSSDEVTIESDADEDRILEVLSVLGREDEFPHIRKEAYDKFDIGVSHEMPEWTKNLANRPPPDSALAEDKKMVAEELRSIASRRPTFSHLKERLADVK